MPTIRPNASKRIDKAFAEFTGFQKLYSTHLRKLVHKAIPGIKEDWKWGPNFNSNGMVCGIWGFKGHVKLVFFKGSLMSDKHKLFAHGINNQGNRSIHFTASDKLDDKKIIAYFKEAAELAMALSKDKAAKAYFEGLAPSHRREYANYIAEAKQVATRERRLVKTMEMLADKRKLNDNYMK